MLKNSMSNHLEVIDPREGLPSASGAPRWWNCPASHNLEQEAVRRGMASAGEFDEIQAMSGTILHEALCGKRTEESLGLQSQKSLAKLRACINLALSDWRNHYGLPAPDEATGTNHYGIWISKDEDYTAEERWWLKHPDGSKRMSGQQDLIVMTKDRRYAMLIDVKTGHGLVQRSDISRHLQLRVLAALAYYQYGCEEIRVSIAEVYSLSNVAKFATYNSNGIARVVQQLDQRLNAIYGEDPEYKSGEWCRYCKAKLICHKTKAEFVRLDRHWSKIEKGVQEWDQYDWEYFLNAAQRVSNFVKEGRERARKLLEENPDAISGWRLLPTDRAYKIESIPKLWAYLERAGVSREGFTKSLTMTKAAFVSLLQDELCLSKDQSEEEWEQLCRFGLVTKKPTPMLVKATQRPADEPCEPETVAENVQLIEGQTKKRKRKRQLS